MWDYGCNGLQGAVAHYAANLNSRIQMDLMFSTFQKYKIQSTIKAENKEMKLYCTRFFPELLWPLTEHL